MGNKKCGYRYSDEDLRWNFISICKELGRVPLFQEFNSISKISDITYANRLNLKGKVYDSIVKTYVGEDEYKKYIIEKSEHKTNVGKKTGSLSRIFSDKDLETNFRYVFDTYVLKYNTYPSRRLFDKVSCFDSSVYRRKLGMSWTDVCKKYGYEIDNRYKEENILLGMCENLFGCSYIPQKTWDWLIGVGGKHMFCDGYFQDINLVVEFDGVMHRVAVKGNERLKRQQENDILKEELLNDNNINLIRIDSRLKWYEKESLSSIIKDECLKRNINFDELFLSKSA